MEEVVTEGAKSRERIKNGRILRSASSHVREEVFFCPEKNKKNEEVGGGSQGEVVMESAPRSSLKVIETEVILVALEVLFDLEALTAQAQQRDASRRSIQPGGVNMVRFGLALAASRRPTRFRESHWSPQQDRRPSMRGSKPFGLRMLLQSGTARPARLRPSESAAG